MLRRKVLATLLGCVLNSAAVAQTTEPLLQPIFSRYAQTASKLYLDTTLRYFEDVQLQEADDFDGWGLDAEVTYPFRRNMQLRFVVPLYTEGTAVRTEPPNQGAEIDIEGNGGTFDFFSVIFEHQVKANTLDNLAYFAGGGTRLEELETSTDDVFNHQGNVILGGIKFDRYYERQQTQLIVNLGGRYYFSSDDLNPAGGSDTFFMLEASAAAVFNRWKRVYPVGELVYQGVDFDYNSLLFVPEAIFPVNAGVSVKLGVPIGLTSDGEQLGLRFRVTAQF
ncbi:MAG: hypothetical protein R3268_01140 [Acidiferrobacterales bacterium]|nr:hypothetical protein [Acidiferrobacterales bacterium]